MQANDQAPAILRPAAAAQYIGISRSKLWQLEQRDPSFPRKITFSIRCVGYRRQDLDAYLAQKAGAA